MPDSAAQQFLRDLDKKLWGAADRLRASLDAAVYKHAVLGLIFLKYVSDSFGVRQKEIEAQLRDPKSDYFLDPKDYKKPEAYDAPPHQASPAQIQVPARRPGRGCYSRPPASRGASGRLEFKAIAEPSMLRGAFIFEDGTGSGPWRLSVALVWADRIGASAGVHPSG